MTPVIRALLRGRRLVFVAVVVAGVLLSAGAFVGEWSRTRRQVEDAFRSDAAQHFGTLKEEIEDSVNGGSAVADFVQTVGRVSRDEFREFALAQLRRSRGILALAWSPHVPQAGGRGAFPVRYAESLAGADGVVIAGADLAAGPASRDAIERARDTGGPAMTASLPLRHGATGVHIHWPIYAKGQPRDSLEARRRSLRGVVTAIFDVDHLLETACEIVPPQSLDVAVFDAGAPPGQPALAHDPSRVPAPRPSWLGKRVIEDRIRSGLAWSGTVELGGRRWTMSLTPTAGYVATRVTSQMWEALLVGLVTTTLVAGYLLLLMRRTGEVEALVAVRTRDLQRAHDRLLVEVRERTRAQAQARRLTQEVLGVQEEERRRLARELHDEAGQAFTTLLLNLRVLQAEAPKHQTALRDRLREVGALAQSAVERIRVLARGLRPPGLDALGLNTSLRGLSDDVARRTGVSITYEGADLPSLPDAVTICLYRVLQEALTNVVKHAAADRVCVVLRDDGPTIRLSVEDDGRGFDPGAVSARDGGRGNGTGGLGLLGMRERLELVGGRLEVLSRPGHGARLVAHVPASRGPASLTVLESLRSR